MKFPLSRHSPSGITGILLCMLAAAGAVACSDDTTSGDRTGDPADDDTDDDTNDRPATFEAQVERGGMLFGEHCAECHGDAGQGTADGPLVVGEGRLPLDPPPEREVRTGQFRTALDVFAFASVNMPGDAPGTLPDEDMVDILAFALFANGVELEEPLGFDNAESVVINAE